MKSNVTLANCNRWHLAGFVIWTVCLWLMLIDFATTKDVVSGIWVIIAWSRSDYHEKRVEDSQ